MSRKSAETQGVRSEAPHSLLLTFLIADVRGYTRFTREHGDEAAARLAERFADLIEEVVTDHQGNVVELRGDEALVVFGSARNALRCSLALQTAFTRERTVDPALPLVVGIGIDAGEAVPIKGGYRGGALNLAARLCSVAGPGQVLATTTVISLSGTVEGLDYTEREPVALKGYADPVQVIDVHPSEAAVPPPAGHVPALPLPTGTTAFLYTDIEGSTRLWQEHPVVMPQVLARHDALLQQAIGQEGGMIFRHAGDGYCAAFVHTGAAVRAAITAQQALPAEPWAEEITLAVRMAIHTGSVEVREDVYVGHTLNRVARLLAAAHGGQVLLSGPAYELVRDNLPEAIELRDLGEHRLKDLLQPEHIYQLAGPNLRSDFPMLASLPAEETRGEISLPTGGFLGSLPTDQLIGRTHELARLLASVTTVEERKGRCVLLAGEPGIGKTRLAQEVTVALQERGFVLAAGRCYEPEQTVPYYPFLDALAMAYAAAPASLRSTISARWPYLGVLLPQEIGAPKDEGGPDTQQSVFRAVAGFLEAVSAIRPLAFLIDDLHWIDSTSLRLLVHVAQHTRTMPVLILGTYRDVEVGPRHPLAGALRDLHRDGLLERIHLRHLDEEGTAALVASTLGRDEMSEELASLLFSRTEGNPYFVHQILRALVERGDVFQRDGMWDRRAIEDIEVPDSVRSVVMQRFTRLAETTQEVLQQASALGQTFAFDDLVSISEQPEREIEDALDEASGTELIREIGRDAYSFDHALTQQSIYAELPSRRRRRLHLAAGTALEQSPVRTRAGRAAEIARHFLEADDAARAVRHMLLAGDQAEAVYAHSEAALQYRRAAQIAADLGQEGTQAEALEKLGNVHELESRPDKELDALESAAHIYHAAGDLMGEARVTAGVGSALMHLGKPDEAIERLRTILTVLDDQGPSTVLARLSLQLSAILYGHGEFDAGMELAIKARDIARAVGDVATLAGAELYRGDVLMQMGRMDDARQIFESVLPDAEAMGDLGILAHAANDVAVTYIYTGRFTQGVQRATQAVDLQRRRDAPTMVAFADVMLALAHFYAGEWTEARRALEEALVLIEQLPPSWHAPFVYGYLGMVDTVEGRWVEAQEHLEKAIAIGAESRVALPVPHQWLADREIIEGEPAAARARLEPLAADRSVWTLMMLPTLAWAQVESGDIVAAEALATSLVTDTTMQIPLVVAEALRVQAMVRWRQGREEEAEHAFEEALALTREMGYRHSEGRVLYEQGRMHGERGDRPRAAAELEAARALFHGLGAQPDVERTERATAQC